LATQLLILLRALRKSIDGVGAAPFVPASVLRDVQELVASLNDKSLGAVSSLLVSC
jgi:hypothetical protein